MTIQAVAALVDLTVGTASRRVGGHRGASPEAESAAARELLRGLIDATGWVTWTAIDRGRNGRPILRSRPDVGVSISHSRGWVMAGIARDADIGVDVEAVTAVFDQPALERMACSTSERRRLSGRRKLARRHMMADLWTEKEATLKALGVGLLTDPRRAGHLGADVFRIVPGRTGVSASVAVLPRRRSDERGGSE